MYAYDETYSLNNLLVSNLVAFTQNSNFIYIVAQPACYSDFARRSDRIIEMADGEIKDHGHK